VLQEHIQTPGTKVASVGNMAGGHCFQACFQLLAAGVTWQRSSCIDSHGCPLLSDAYGAPLTFSGQPSDSSLMGLASMVYR
jgi:hypothetical protein